MYKSHLLVCCSQLLVDPVENYLSAIDIIEDLQSSAFPYVYPKFCLSWILGREPSDPEKMTAVAKIRLNSEILKEFEFEVDFQGATRTRAMLIVRGVAFSRPGKVRVDCSMVGSGDFTAAYEFELMPIVTSDSPKQPA